jgi:hypothetical protein
MRNRRMDEREKAGQGGEAVGLADGSRGLRGNAVPPALRRLWCVRLCCSLVLSLPYMTTVLFRRARRDRKQDVHTIITLTDNNPLAYERSRQVDFF